MAFDASTKTIGKGSRQPSVPSINSGSYSGQSSEIGFRLLVVGYLCAVTAAVSVVVCIVFGTNFILQFVRWVQPFQLVIALVGVVLGILKYARLLIEWLKGTNNRSEKTISLIWGAVGLLRTDVQQIRVDVSCLEQRGSVPGRPAAAEHDVMPCAQDLYERGREHHSKHNYAEAIVLYDEALRLNPRLPKALCCRGHAHYMRRDYYRAIADCNEAIKLAPKLPDSLHVRGRARWRIGDPDGAIADFAQAIVLNPKFVFAFYNRGRIYHIRGTGKDLDRAIADYSNTIDLEPTFTYAYYYRGRARHIKGDVNGAVADYNSALRIDPKLDIAMYYRDLALRHKGTVSALRVRAELARHESMLERVEDELMRFVRMQNGFGQSGLLAAT